MTATLRPLNSTAISGVAYVPLSPAMKRDAPRQGFILIRFRSGGTYAYLAPSWKYGLLLAGRSTGRAYHQPLRGKSPEVKLSGKEAACT